MSEEYPSNAHNQPARRPARERQKTVVHGVQVRKKPLSARIHERGAGIIKDIIYEVIGPYFRDMGADMFYTATDRAFYGDSIHGRSSRPGRPGGSKPGSQVTAAGYVVTDYNAQYVGGGNSASAPTYIQGGQKQYDFSIYSFPNYSDGRELIDRLNHIIMGAGHATVNDLYDMLGQSYDHPGENWGWDGLESLRGAEVRRVRGGGAYYLDIPDAQPLKK